MAATQDWPHLAVVGEEREPKGGHYRYVAVGARARMAYHGCTHGPPAALA